MSYYVSQALIYLIIIPASIGWVRYKNISPAYFPFLVLMWVGASNEIVSFFVIRIYNNNIINYNFYLLIESLLILWQFHRWRLFEKKKTYRILQATFLIAWILECLFLSKLYLGFNSYFQIFYSFVIVLMSVNMINHVLMRERGSLLKSPLFIVCSVFVILFTYAVVVETFWAYGLQMSTDFKVKLQHIFVVINFLCNTIYTLAILWMPKRQAFTLQY